MYIKYNAYNLYIVIVGHLQNDILIYTGNFNYFEDIPFLSQQLTLKKIFFHAKVFDYLGRYVAPASLSLI